MRLPASACAAALTAGLCRACQVANKVTPFASARQDSSSISLKRHRRRLFEQDVKARLDALAGDLVPDDWAAS